ncbi:hypothetical protein CAP39_07815 [Sphingomonas sp. IBVSS1]|nr:hypothetical protein CAP39_07815 [Sphingomonas sp. IBVSS1]
MFMPPTTRLILLLGVGLCCGATPALAADADTEAAEIIVTASIDRYAPRTLAATRTDTPALELPFSVDTVGAALLADRGLVGLTDALRTVSGTNPVGGIGDFNTRFRLRGFARFDAALYLQPLEAVQVQLNLINIGNARYFENGNTNNNFYPGQPRTLRANALVRF